MDNYISHMWEPITGCCSLSRKRQPSKTQQYNMRYVLNERFSIIINALNSTCSFPALTSQVVSCEKALWSPCSMEALWIQNQTKQRIVMPQRFCSRRPLPVGSGHYRFAVVQSVPGWRKVILV